MNPINQTLISKKPSPPGNLVLPPLALIGMSGAGKTKAGAGLAKDCGFTLYAIDDAIAHKYLAPHLRGARKSKKKSSHATERKMNDNISATISLSDFIGKLGINGQSLTIYRRRQKLYGRSEVAAMREAPLIIKKMRKSSAGFVMDCTGSIVEVMNRGLLNLLKKKFLVVYLHFDQKQQSILLKRQMQHPKPMYYQPKFLTAQIANYCQQHKLKNIAQADQLDFSRFIFKAAMARRLSLYQELAKNGVVLDAEKFGKLRSGRTMLLAIIKSWQEKK